MRFSATLLALPAIASAALYSSEEYRSGDVHQQLMEIKNAHWDQEEAEGLLDPTQYRSLRTNPLFRNDPVRCRDGLAVVEEGNANQTFRCNNMDL